jgi:hypothetical protein
LTAAACGAHAPQAILRSCELRSMIDGQTVRVSRHHEADAHVGGDYAFLRRVTTITRLRASTAVEGRVQHTGSRFAGIREKVTNNPFPLQKVGARCAILL